MGTHGRAGMALIEVVVLAGCAACLLPMAGVAMGGNRVSARAITDSTYVRGIHQGLVMWAQNNQDNYPLPGELDQPNATIKADVSKELPRYVVSVLIYNGFFGPELCVSPAEVNPEFQAMQTYAYSTPELAANPQQALWDPAFKAYPMDEDGPEKDGVKAGFSYAMTPWVGARKAKWTNSFSATEAVLAWRGPAYDAVGASGGPATNGATLKWKLAPEAKEGRRGVGSERVRFPLSGKDWKGNVVWNDNHVEAVTSPTPETAPYTFTGLAAERRVQPDNLFVNENDTTRLPETEELTGEAGGNANNLMLTWGRATVEKVGEKKQQLKDLKGGLWWD